VCTGHCMQALVGMLGGLVTRGVDDDVGPQEITQDIDFQEASLRACYAQVMHSGAVLCSCRILF
jgi:hypothetical protein